jgi:hypothetical protein
MREYAGPAVVGRIALLVRPVELECSAAGSLVTINYWRQRDVESSMWCGTWIAGVATRTIGSMAPGICRLGDRSVRDPEIAAIRAPAGVARRDCDRKNEGWPAGRRRVAAWRSEFFSAGARNGPVK